MNKDDISEPRRLIADPDRPIVTLAEVDIRAELQSRPFRVPDYAAEHQALTVLTKEMAENPRNMLQKLVETALDLCRADSAGISILEGDVFRWEALAGVFAAARNSTMPRDASPCGVCIDRDATQLMHLPDLHFPASLADPRFVEALLIPFHIHGRPVGTVWIVAHSELRKFDREDERIMSTLAQLAAAAWQLWQASESAIESNRDKDEFIAILAHELRNPLAAILGAGGILRSAVRADPAALRFAEIVERQARHLRRLVDDLVDLSRMKRGKLEIRKEPIELRTIIDQAVETVQTRIDSAHHRLLVQIPDQPIFIDGDRERLCQLFANLLDNAVKFTPPGGEIRISAEAAGDEVVIDVCDSGIGLNQDRLESVFELFTQHAESQSRSARGIGVGLALVRTLAELHGGSVKATSGGPDQGSQFTVRLPYFHAPQLPVEKAAPLIAPTE